MSAQRQDHFWPQGNNLNNPGRGPVGEAVYQMSKAQAFWFQIRRFLKVFSICLCKICQPKGGAIFWPQGNLNNLGRGPLGEAMYQISKAWAFCFQTRRFLKFFPTRVYVKQVTPWHRPIFDPRAII